MHHGLIAVYKEPGFTSFDVVAKLRGILKQKKIGHTGTLDPAAEGVLLVCLGDGTKLVELLEDRSKEYQCQMLLGTETDTEDTTGTVIKTSPVNSSPEEIIATVNSFIGDYNQVPPMYSALKVDGKKMYELARQGIVIERKARAIKINSIEVNNIDLPYVTFTCDCSKGTYIRSLCRDIGLQLGTGATMNHLTRTRVGHYTIKDCLTLSQIEEYSKAGTISNYIINIEDIFKDYPSIYVKDSAIKLIDNGNPLWLQDVNTDTNPVQGCLYKVYNPFNSFKAIYSYNSEKERFIPEKIFPNL